MKPLRFFYDANLVPKLQAQLSARNPLLCFDDDVQVIGHMGLIESRDTAYAFSADGDFIIEDVYKRQPLH